MTGTQTSDLQETLIESLGRTGKWLRGAGMPPGMVLAMEELARQVKHPCVVAVVGRVNAGKSTFINALLGQDLAAVGNIETTATINYFSFGDTDPARPVYCHWRGGRITQESQAFLDNLQGNDLETLRRSDGIGHLEYLLPNSLLSQITLVDTPGTGGVVGKHQSRTAEFVNLSEQLRVRHDQDTRRLENEADAVIYLVGSTAMAADKEFLQEFAQATGGQSRPLNTLGVMAKTDLNPEVLASPHEFSERVAEQLKDNLNTVVPVSAGLQRTLDRLLENDQAELKRLVGTLRRIPSTTLEILLDDEGLFREAEFPDCPVPGSERQSLRDGAPWMVFVTIARVAADDNLTPEEVVHKLRDISGFERLREILTKHFIERGRILRYYRIVNDARRILQEVKFTHLRERRDQAREDEIRLDRFLAFIRRRDEDAATASELEAFVRRHLEAGEGANKLEKLWEELDEELVELLYRLREDNADFKALQRLEEQPDYFSPSEVKELRALLGRYGSEIEKRLSPGRAGDVAFVSDREIQWQQTRLEAPRRSARQALAERAWTRYRQILDALLDEEEETAPDSTHPL